MYFNGKKDNKLGNKLESVASLNNISRGGPWVVRGIGGNSVPETGVSFPWLFVLQPALNPVSLERSVGDNLDFVKFELWLFEVYLKGKTSSIEFANDSALSTWLTEVDLVLDLGLLAELRVHLLIQEIDVVAGISV